jgi:hypothetical protein
MGDIAALGYGKGCGVRGVSVVCMGVRRGRVMKERAGKRGSKGRERGYLRNRIQLSTPSPPFPLTPYLSHLLVLVSAHTYDMSA